MIEGRRLLHYVLVERLGAGGMGEVWLARDTALEREVALKFLHPGLAVDLESEERLLREARAASALDHPGILTIHALEHAEGRAFLVMERLRGLPIDEAARGRDHAFAVALCVQVADALAAAHARGIVHRDVKPSNLFVDERGRVVVMDFGLARIADAPQLTRSGTTLGTLGYTAPEQLRGEEVDASADVFALGAVLYELLAGRPAFERGQGVGAVIRAVLEDEPPPVADLDPALDRVMRRALAKDGTQRFKEAGALRDALQAWSDGGRPAELHNERRAGRNPWLVVSGALAVLAGAIGIWTFHSRGRQGGEEPVSPPLFGEHWRQRRLNFIRERLEEPALSPDGSTLAFVSEEDGRPQVFVADIADPAPRAITRSVDGVREPVWSADGKQLLVHEQAQGEQGQVGRVLLVPALGGEPRVLLERARNASFGADGAKVVFERDGGIFTHDLTSGNAQRIRADLGSVAPQFSLHPALSSAGDTLAFVRSELGPLGVIEVLDLGSGQQRRLVSERARYADLAFTPDGSSLVFASDRGGALNLWSVRVEDGALAQLTSGAGDDLSPSTTSTRMVFQNRRDDYEVVLWDPATNLERVLHRSRGSLMSPRFAPDSTRIVFSADDGAAAALFVLDIASGEARRATSGQGELRIFPRWIDDRRVLCYRDSSTGSDLIEVDLESGAERVLVPGWSMQDHPFAEPAPGGQRLAVFGVQPPGTFIVELDSASRAVVASEPGPLLPALRARWNPDGTWLVAESFFGGIVRLEAGVAPAPLAASGRCPVISRDGRELLFVRPSEVAGSWLVVAKDLDSGVERTVHETIARLPETGGDLDVDVEGRLLWSRFVPRTSELWLLEK